MKRWIYTHCEIAGSPALVEQRLLDRSAELLRLAMAAPAREPAGDGSFLMALGSRVARVHVAKQVRITTGVARHGRRRVVLPVSWHAEPMEWLFPTFAGGIAWEPLTQRRGRLALSGSYTTPLGFLGGAIDATLLRPVARRTAEQLLAGVAHELRRDMQDGAPISPPPTDGQAPRLPLRVRDAMIANPVVLDSSLPLRSAALVLLSAEVRGAAVVRQDGELVGVLTESDILAAEAARRFAWRQHAAGGLRRREPTTVAMACSMPARVTAPDARLSAAAREMLDHHVSRLVVVGGGRVVGMLSRHDVVSALVRDDAELLTDVRALMDRGGSSSVRTTVESGVVTLHGTTQLRTTAISLRRRIQRIDGVVAIDDRELHWEVDDVIPPIATRPGM